jgi:hypothetical protein
MQLALIILLASGLVELLLYFNPIWRIRRQWAPLAMAAILVFLMRLALILPVAALLPLAFFCIYRWVNLWRVFKGRVQIDYLYNSARRASGWLILLQLLALALFDLGRTALPSVSWWLGILALIQLVLITALLFVLRSNLKALYSDSSDESLAAKDLPTLTVAIPARNETHELEECLRSLVASDYPKLEIIVLDDSSQDKRTPEIIRSFAHDGVRFIPGEAPPDSWLAKNYAYKQLAEAANGDLLLFCGVDVTFEASTLTTLVTSLLKGGRDMICLLPRNQADDAKLQPLLVQPLRYGWELALPRQLLKRPPVLSTSWLIRRSALAEAGGFEAVSRKIIPESYFARQAAAGTNGYKLLAASPQLGLSSHKSFSEQRDTAIRTRYPQLHKRPEMAAILTLAEFYLFLSPLLSLAVSAVYHAWLASVISIAGFTVVALFNVNLSKLAYRQFMTASLWSAPLAFAYDIGLLNYSMWRYEFGEVLWKGRNVCVPVMRALPLDSAQTLKK